MDTIKMYHHHIYASQVAKATGYNPYATPNELMLEMFKREFPEDYNCNDKKTIKDQFEQIAKTDSNVRELQKVTEQLIKDSTTNKQVNNEKVQALLKDQQPIVREMLTRSINTTFGTNMEPDAIDTYQKKYKALVRENNAKYHHRSIGNGISIGGKHDGIDSNTGTLLEVKNRTSERIFRKQEPPMYDVIQTMCYMYIYRIDKAKIIENYRGEMKETTIEWDDELWTNVVEKLYAFMERYKEFCNKNRK